MAARYRAAPQLSHKAMKQIPLNKEQVAIISDEDYERVSQYKWSAILDGGSWYARTRVVADGKISKPRLQTIITGFNRTTHLNGDTLDCRRENLRHGRKIVTRRKLTVEERIQRREQKRIAHERAQARKRLRQQHLEELALRREQRTKQLELRLQQKRIQRTEERFKKPPQAKQEPNNPTERLDDPNLPLNQCCPYHLRDTNERRPIYRMGMCKHCFDGQPIRKGQR